MKRLYSTCSEVLPYSKQCLATATGEHNSCALQQQIRTVADLAMSGFASSCSEGVNLHRVDTRMLSTSTRLRYLLARKPGGKQHLTHVGVVMRDMDHLTPHGG